MADPFSLVASVLGVVATALTVAKKLHEWVGDFKEAYSHLVEIAEHIRHNAVLLKCTIHLIQEHDDLFRNELRSLVRDVNGQFANISDLFGKLLPKSRTRKRDRFRMKISALWSSKKLEELVVKLNGLRSMMSAILSVAQLAQNISLKKSNALDSQRIRVEAIRALDRKLLTFDEPPSDMATWMALHLSAPTMPTKPLLAPANSRDDNNTNNIQVVNNRGKAVLPFGPLVRAQPRIYQARIGDPVQVAFDVGTLDPRTLKLLDVPSREEVSHEGTRELVLRPKEKMKPHQLDLLIGIDLMVRLPKPNDWSIQQSPFMHLNKDISLFRLLLAWTKLGQNQIRKGMEIAHEEPVLFDTSSHPEYSSDSETDSDGGAETVTNRDEDEDTGLPAAANRGMPVPSEPPRNHDDRHRERLSGGRPVRFEDIKKLERPARDAWLGPGTVHTIADDESTWQPRQRDEKPYIRGRFEYQTRSPHTTADSLAASRARARRSIGQRGRHAASFWPPASQTPRAPSAPSPPPPPMMYHKRSRFPDTIGDDTRNATRPVSPSMLASPVTVKHSGLAKPNEVQATEKEREDPIKHLENKYEEIERAKRGEVANERQHPSGAPSETLDELRLRIRKQVEMEYWKPRKPNLDIVESHIDPSLPHGLEGDSRTQIESEALRQESLAKIYTDTLEKTSAEWKRKEDHQRQLVEDMKLELRAEFSVAREAMATELEELKSRLRAFEETERAKMIFSESQKSATTVFDTENHEEVSESPEALLEEYDVFSHMIVNYTTFNERNVDHWMDHISDGDSPSTADIAFDDKVVGDSASSSMVERSKPWKGAAHLGKFSGMAPFYQRGSDTGQIWYRGADPIYVIEFEEGFDEKLSLDQASAYLLISKFWVDYQALDKLGFKHVECPPVSMFLDPSLTSEDIQVLVDLTFALREVETFRTLQAKDAASMHFHEAAPPSADFFRSVIQDQDSGGRWALERIHTVLGWLRKFFDILGFLLRTI